MKPMLCVMLAGALLGGPLLASAAEAGDPDRRQSRHERDRRHARERDDDRDWDRYDRRARYFGGRDVVVIREYYRPHHRPLPRGVKHKYYRYGYLPRGWAKRMRPVPVYVERELIVLPHGYRRGVIDGHAIVYNTRGLIIDVAVLF